MEEKRKIPKLEEVENKELKFATNALRDLMKDSTSSKQRKVFEDIYKAIEKANEKERRLNLRCSKLQSEVEANASKIKAAIQLSIEDKNTIDTLKEELEKAWNAADELKMERYKNMDADSFSERDKRSHRDSLYSSSLSLKRKDQEFEETEKKWTLEKKSLQSEIEIQRKTSEDLKSETKQLQQQLKNINSILNTKNEDIKQLETNLKLVEEINVDKELGKGDQTVIFNEIEKYRLQIFELEEEVTDKERMIEELTKENEQKKAELEQLRKEIRTVRKDSFLSGNVEAKKSHPLVKQNKKNKNRRIKKGRINTIKQIDEFRKKENETALKLKFLEVNLSKTTSMLSKTQNDNYMLDTALHREKALYNTLSEKFSTLQVETNKIIKTLKELEYSKNKYVFVIGKLETKNFRLETELTTLEHCKYPEKIKNLENDILNTRRELEEKENCLKETSEEITKIRLETEELSKHLIESVKVIRSIYANDDVYIERKSNFGDTKLYSHKENIHSLIFNLKEKIKDLVEDYKETMMQKYKLYDEIEILKNQRYKVKEQESKYTETEYLSFEQDQHINEESETYLDGRETNSDIIVPEMNLDFPGTDLDESEKLNEQKTTQENNYLSSIKPEISSCLEINTFNYPLEYKSPKVDLNNLPAKLNEERISSFTTISHKKPREKKLENKSKIREVAGAHAFQKIIKSRQSLPGVITSQDLVEYRKQLRTKQKKLDVMEKELESNSSTFSTNSVIYKKDSKKRIMKTESGKKLSIGKNVSN